MVFNEVSNEGLVKSVFESRFTGFQSSDVILRDMMARYDFGQDFFHKILNKSILRPGSIQTKP